LAQFVGLVGVLALTASACSSGASPSPSSAAEASSSPAAAPATSAPATSSPAAEPVTITYAFWDANQQPAIDKQIAAYQALHPNVTVQTEVTPWTDYWTKLQTALAGGAGPDVLWMNGPNFPVYAAAGALAPLTVDVSQYPQSLVNLYTYNGQLYGVPKDFDTIALYYNKALFDKAGVAYPTGDWTWDDLRAAAKKLTVTKNGKVTQAGFAAIPSFQEVYFDLMFQNGGQPLSADGLKSNLADPANCDALQFLYSIQKDGSSLSAAEMQSNQWEVGNLFGAGKIAMDFGGSWRVLPFSQASKDIDVAPLPKGKQQATVIHGVGQAVWAGGPHKDAATDFVTWLGTKDAQTIFANESANIPAMNGLQEKWVSSVPTIKLQTFLDELSYAVPLPVTPKGFEWVTAQDQVYQSVWLGQTPADQMCQKAQEAADAALSK
jgi:multiple sugar transport system substrate-binding protein